MKALFGMVSLLVVLAVVGLLAARQFRSVSAPLVAAPGMPAIAASGTVAQQARQVEQQFASDAARALSQGAQAHQDASDEAGKP